MSASARRMERVLVVRLSAMGDVIHTLTAVTALREAFPSAQIDWLIEQRWAELLYAPGAPRRGARSCQRPLVDAIHTVRLTDWRKSLMSVSTAQRIATVWNDVRMAKYDVAIDLQGAIRSAILACLSGAREVFGSAEPRESPASLWYTRKAIPRGSHVIEQYLSIVEALIQRKLRIPHPALPRDPAAETRVAELLTQRKLTNFAVINPGAGWGAKQWPAERYGEVARELARSGICTVVNYGPGEEQLARRVEAASEGASHALKFSITELIALLRQAQIFIGGDTGPLHLAAALKVPVVAIFGPTDPARNGPYQTRSIVLRSPQSQTSHTRVSQPDQGLLSIGVGDVVHAAHALLAGAIRG